MRPRGSCNKLSLGSYPIRRPTMGQNSASRLGSELRGSASSRQSTLPSGASFRRRPDRSVTAGALESSSSARVLHQAPDRPADALVRAMGQDRTAGAGSGSSRTPLIHPAPFRAPRILLVVIGRRSASAPASPSRGPGNGILRAETGGQIQARTAGERSEFGSQTATRLANRRTPCRSSVSLRVRVRRH